MALLFDESRVEWVATVLLDNEYFSVDDLVEIRATGSVSGQFTVIREWFLWTYVYVVVLRLF